MGGEEEDSAGRDLQPSGSEGGSSDDPGGPQQCLQQTDRPTSGSSGSAGPGQVGAGDGSELLRSSDHAGDNGGHADILQT